MRGGTGNLPRATEVGSAISVLLLHGINTHRGTAQRRRTSVARVGGPGVPTVAPGLFPSSPLCLCVHLPCLPPRPLRLLRVLGVLPLLRPRRSAVDLLVLVHPLPAIRHHLSSMVHHLLRMRHRLFVLVHHRSSTRHHLLLMSHHLLVMRHHLFLMSHHLEQMMRICS